MEEFGVNMPRLVSPSSAQAFGNSANGYGNYDARPLAEAIQGRLSQVALTEADLVLVGQCMDELAVAVLRLGQRWCVQPFGGIANGFGISSSDLDVTCYVEGMDASYASVAMHEMRTHLVPLLSENPRFEIVEQIWNARIPILKLRFDAVLDVDLSCHNAEALPNTQLLRAYSDLAPAVHELGLLVKLWARSEGVCGARSGYLSSYSLTLMAIYYLQVDPAVQMPCLPTHIFTGRGLTPQAARVAWTCRFPTTAA